MFSRGVAVCSVLALAAVAQGGVAVTLVPNPNQAFYTPNQVVQVDVNLAQVGGTVDQLLRMVEFDLQASNPFLTVALPLTHERTPGIGDDIYFWSFSSLLTCRNVPTECGFNYFIDGSLAAGPVDTRLNVLSIAYLGLIPSATAQIFLAASGAPVTVGKLTVTMPAADGDYTLNLANATVTGADQGARVDVGFDPHLIWRARLASPNDVSGGTYLFHVGTPRGACCVGGITCNTGVTQATCTGQGGVYQGNGSTSCVNCPATNNATLVSSIPPFTAVGEYHPPGPGTGTYPAVSTLWRSLRHVIRLTFNLNGGPALVLPTAGQFQVNELLAAGAFGPDLSASFTPTIEGGNVLRLKEILAGSPPASVLVHKHWYAVRSTGGWAGVAPFEAHWLVIVGDADGNRITNSFDVGAVNAAPGGPAADQSRFDINGDGVKNSFDVGAANASPGGPGNAKPSGH